MPSWVSLSFSIRYRINHNTKPGGNQERRQGIRPQLLQESTSRRPARRTGLKRRSPAPRHARRTIRGFRKRLLPPSAPVHESLRACLNRHFRRDVHGNDDRGIGELRGIDNRPGLPLRYRSRPQESRRDRHGRGRERLSDLHGHGNRHRRIKRSCGTGRALFHEPERDYLTRPASSRVRIAAPCRLRNRRAGRHQHIVTFE